MSQVSIVTTLIISLILGAGQLLIAVPVLLWRMKRNEEDIQELISIHAADMNELRKKMESFNGTTMRYLSDEVQRIRERMHSIENTTAIIPMLMKLIEDHPPRPRDP